MKNNNSDFSSLIFNPDNIDSFCLKDKFIIEKYQFKKEEMKINMKLDKSYEILKKKFNDFINNYNKEIQEKCLDIQHQKNRRNEINFEYFEKLNYCTNGLTFKVFEVLEIKRNLELKNELEEYYCKINCDKYEENNLKLDKCLNKCINMSKYAEKSLYRVLSDVI